MITPNRHPVKKSFRLIRLAKLLGLFLGLILIWSLTHGLIEIKTAYLRLSEAESTLEAKEERKRQLLGKLAEVKKEDYIEKVAREKLAMQKPEETVVLIEGNERAEAPEVVGGPSEGALEPIYLRWWRLLN